MKMFLKDLKLAFIIRSNIRYAFSLNELGLGFFATTGSQTTFDPKTLSIADADAHCSMGKSKCIIGKKALQTAFREFYDDDRLVVLEFDSKAGVPMGDNYCSELSRISVSYKAKHNDYKIANETIIVKTQIKSEELLMSGIAAALCMFEKESEMYATTFPVMHNLLGGIRLAPKSMLSSSDTIVLEDLKTQGFVMRCRRDGLDFNHSKLVVERLAMLHASSAVAVDSSACLIENYRMGLFSGHKVLHAWMSLGMRSLIEHIKQWPNSKKYAVKLEAIETSLIDRTVCCAKANPEGFNVINHGDAWTNNIMFSYHQDGALKDLRFIDFQMLVYSSPVLDLHYFFSTSIIGVDRENRIEKLFDIYHEQLVNSLKAMNYTRKNVPTKRELKTDYVNRAFYAIITTACISPMCMSSQRNDATFEELMGQTSFREHCYSNAVYKDVVERILPYCDKMGALG